MKPGLPIPVTTRRPLDLRMMSQAFSKSRPTRPMRLVSASRSMRMTSRATLTAIPHRPSEGEEPLEQALEIAQRDHVGAVRRGLVGVLVDFHEHRVRARDDAGLRQHRHELALAARALAEAAGLL